MLRIHRLISPRHLITASKMSATPDSSEISDKVMGPRGYPIPRQSLRDWIANNLGTWGLLSSWRLCAICRQAGLGARKPDDIDLSYQLRSDRGGPHQRRKSCDFCAIVWYLVAREPPGCIGIVELSEMFIAINGPRTINVSAEWKHLRGGKTTSYLKSNIVMEIGKCSIRHTPETAI